MGEVRLIESGIGPFCSSLFSLDLRRNGFLR